MKTLVAIAEVAREWGVTTRCARRRLRCFDAKRAKLDPNGAPLLVQFTEGGQYFADAELLRHHFPALFRGEDPEEDPQRATLAEVREIRRELADVAQDVTFVRDAVAQGDAA